MFKNNITALILAFLLLIVNTSYSLDQFDGDNDYIPDEFELLLAKMFAPTLMITEDDYYAYSYIYKNMKIPFSVDPYKDYYSGKLMIVISYGVPFTYDPGIQFHIESHYGDPEFCQVLIQLKDGFNEGYGITDSFGTLNAWEIKRKKSYAHWFTDFACTRVESTTQDPPIFYVAKDKHGIYLSWLDCLSSNIDNCPTAGYIAVTDYDDLLQNVGSYAFANSPYIDRYIRDATQEHACNCAPFYSNIWEGEDFGGSYQSSYINKFLINPDGWGDDILLRLYTFGGENQTPVNFSYNTTWPQGYVQVGNHVMVGNFTINKDAIVSYKLRNLNLEVVSVIGVGRVHAVTLNHRIDDNSIAPLLGNANLSVGYRTAFEIGNYTVNDNYQMTFSPVVADYDLISSGLGIVNQREVMLTFNKGVNVTGKSVALFEIESGLLIMGEVLPPKVFYGVHDTSFVYRFIPERELNATYSYKLRLTTQDIGIWSGQLNDYVVDRNYSFEPYRYYPGSSNLQWFNPPQQYCFSDDFNDSQLDLTKWNLTGSQSVTESNGEAHIALGSGIKSNSAFGTSIYEARQKHAEEQYYQWHGLMYRVPGSSDYAALYTQAGNLHAYVGKNGQNYGANLGIMPGTDYHLYKIQWESAQTKFYYDGGLVHTEPYALGSNANVTAETAVDDGTGVMDLDLTSVSNSGSQPPNQLAVTVENVNCSGTNASVTFRVNISCRIDVRLKTAMDPNFSVVLKDSTVNWLSEGQSLTIPYTFAQQQHQGNYYFRIHAVVNDMQDSENAGFTKNLPPTIAATIIVPASLSCTTQCPVTINNQCTDIDGGTLTYDWNFRDGSHSYDSGPYISHPNNGYTSAGNYAIQVTVSDGIASIPPQDIGTVHVNGGPTWVEVHREEFSAFDQQGWQYYSNGSQAPRSLIADGADGHSLRINKSLYDGGVVWRNLTDVISGNYPWSIQWSVRYTNPSRYFINVNFTTTTPPTANDHTLMFSTDDSGIMYAYNIGYAFYYANPQIYITHRIEFENDVIKIFVGDLVNPKSTRSYPSYRPTKINLGDWWTSDEYHSGTFDIDYVKIEEKRSTLLASTDSSSQSTSESDLSAATLPKVFTLAQNAPNPFNPSTSIRYAVPEGKTEAVELKVFNIRGQLVKTLVARESRAAGVHTVFWDGNDESGKRVPSGVYMYRMIAGQFSATRKMIILK